MRLKPDNSTLTVFKERLLKHQGKATKRRKEIEKKFGEEKKHHGFDRYRYLSLNRYAIQAYLTGLTVNLKRIMLLTSKPTPS